MTLTNNPIQSSVEHELALLRAVRAVSIAVSSSLNLDDTMNQALQTIVNVTHAEASGISILDTERNELVLRAQLGWQRDFINENPMRIPIGEGLSSQVINEDRPFIFNHLTGKETYAIPSFTEEHFRSLIMMPMHANAKIVGILSIMSHKANNFDTHTVEMMGSIADIVGVAIDNALLYEKHVEYGEQLDAVLRVSGDGILVTDQNGTIHIINPLTESLLGIQAKDLIGLPIRELPFERSFKEQFTSLLQNRDYKSTESHDFVIPKTGTPVTAMISPIVFKSEISTEAQMDGWVIVLQDRTAQRKAELLHARFIKTITHNMKNPLTATQASLKLIELLTGSENETVIDATQIAYKSIDRLKNMIDELTLIESIDNGLDFSPKNIHLGTFIREIKAMIRPLLEARQAELECQIDESIELCCDVTWMRHAILNCLENALYHNPEKIKITLSVYKKDKLIYFDVVDNGLGIPNRLQSRVFDRFFKIENPYTPNEGGGLGLTIVKAVAEAHEGRTYLRSQPTLGTTLGIMIPHRQNRHGKQ